MYKENSIQFNNHDEHSQWIRDNRRTGLKEISCGVVDDVIKITYIKLF